MKRKKIFLVLTLIILITILIYVIFSFIDYGSKYFELLRGLVMLFDLIFFWMLAAKVSQQSKFSFIRDTFVLSGLVMFIIHIILTSITIDFLNEKIILSSNEFTKGNIIQCDESKEYCVYSYTVDSIYYEEKFDNSEINYKYNISDSVNVFYCPQIPSISRIKVN